MKMKALLVGSGHWAQNHIRAYQACKEVELVGLVDVFPGAAVEAVAKQFGIGYASRDLREAVKAVKPDLVDVAANPHYRLEALRAAEGLGVKLFNLEKPLALTPDEAYQIDWMTRAGKARVVVGHQKKWMKTWARMAKVIRDGDLGPIRFYRATCMGNLLEQGTHLVDMVLYFHQYRPLKWVMGQVDDLQGFDKEGAPAPDAAIATLCFDDDTRAYLTLGSAGYAVPGEAEFWFQMAVEAYGDRGHIKNTLNQKLEIACYDKGTLVREDSAWDTDWLAGLSAHLDAAARYAADPAVGHISSMENSIKSYQAIMAIYASAAGAGRVTLPQSFGNSILAKLQARRA
jgi:predicted dehydrogenase